MTHSKGINPQSREQGHQAGNKKVRNKDRIKKGASAVIAMDSKHEITSQPQ